jgi:hypothetical protein
MPVLDSRQAAPYQDTPLARGLARTTGGEARQLPSRMQLFHGFFIPEKTSHAVFRGPRRVRQWPQNHQRHVREGYVIEVSPGVRRLCVCVRGPEPGLLDIACQIGRLNPIYTEYVSAEGLDLGFATPGVNEAALVTDVIAALHAATAQRGAAAVAVREPAVVAFHVGITRVEGDNLRGAAVARVSDVLHAVATATAMGGHALAAGVSAGLFDDIRAECGFGGAWTLLTPAGVWFRVYQAATGAG